MALGDVKPGDLSVDSDPVDLASEPPSSCFLSMICSSLARNRSSDFAASRCLGRI
jgi:hypothetical protein